MEEERIQALERSLERLTEEQRETIDLIDYQDVGYEEAARRMGISVDAARQRHHRAIARLREVLGGDPR